VLATGDTAAAAARSAGIEMVRAGLLPADKAALVNELRQRRGPVAMVGDGINDAPALAAADIGIAVATGTGAAMAAADITLVHGGVGAVADAVLLARATRRIIRQNLGWAFGYNLTLVPLAAAGILPPVLAAAAMAASSVTVVGNALRLRRFGTAHGQASRPHQHGFPVPTPLEPAPEEGNAEPAVRLSRPGGVRRAGRQHAARRLVARRRGRGRNLCLGRCRRPASLGGEIMRLRMPARAAALRRRAFYLGAKTIRTSRAA
jgi:hypothetical protein